MRAIMAGELERMRMTREASFDQTCIRRRIPKTTTASGGSAAGTALNVTYACRAHQNGSLSERAYAEHLGVVTPWWLTFAHDADVLATDQIILGGRTLEVIAPVNKLESNMTALSVICEDRG